MSRTPGEYEVVFWNVREFFPIIIRMSSNTSTGFEQANQPFLTDIERRHLLNFCVVGMRLYLINWMRNLNSSPQVVVQRVSSFQLNYTTFSTQISPDIIQHSLNWQRLPSTTSHLISLELLINHWESISSLSYYRGFRSNQVWWRYTEKTLSREGISILTSHHVERVEAVSFFLNVETWSNWLLKGKMIVTEQGEGMHVFIRK